MHAIVAGGAAGSQSLVAHVNTKFVSHVSVAVVAVASTIQLPELTNGGSATQPAGAGGGGGGDSTGGGGGGSTGGGGGSTGGGAGGGGGGSSVQSFWLKQPEPLVHVLPAAHSKGGLQVVPEASCGTKRF